MNSPLRFLLWAIMSFVFASAAIVASEFLWPFWFGARGTTMLFLGAVFLAIGFITLQLDRAFVQVEKRLQRIEDLLNKRQPEEAS